MSIVIVGEASDVVYILCRSTLEEHKHKVLEEFYEFSSLVYERRSVVISTAE